MHAVECLMDNPIIKKKAAKFWQPSFFGAGNEARTRDPQLGKLMLYQLSYSRITFVEQK